MNLTSCPGGASLAWLVCAAAAVGGVRGVALAQVGMPGGARQWIHVGANAVASGTCCDDAVGGVGSIPFPSPDYVGDPSYPVAAYIYANGDATANRQRIAVANQFCTGVFLYNSMLDTYTISGPPGTEGMPVTARLVYSATGTIFVGNTNTISGHVGNSNARIEVGTWNPSTDPAFSEQFRVTAFDTTNFSKLQSIPSANYGTTTPTLELTLVIDRDLSRTVGTPFDLAFGFEHTGNGAGNLAQTNSPAAGDYIVAEIDWELPAGYTITSTLGWTDPDGPSPHCRADFDGDGDAGTDADIEAYFACLGGACCPSCGSPDFDGDGDAGTDADIESFFRVLGGGAC